MKYKSLATCLKQYNVIYNEASAQSIVNDVLAAMKQQLLLGNPVLLPGIVGLSVVHRAPRLARNPKKPDQTINIPARKRLAFKQSKDLNLDGTTA